MKKTITTIITLILIITNIGLASAISPRAITRERTSIFGGLDPYFMCSINSTGNGTCNAKQDYNPYNLTILIDITYENDPNATTTIKSLLGFREKTITGSHRVLIFFFKGQTDLKVFEEMKCKVDGKAFYVAVQNLTET